MSGEHLPPVYDAARTHAPDRYLSALLAPRTVRGDLVALAGFAGEIERIPLTVSDPNLGEIRLQWWADSLDPQRLGPAGAMRTGHPVADAVAEMLVRRGLPADPLRRMIEARRTELWADPIGDDAAFARLATDLEEGAFELAARVLGARADVGCFARAYGMMRQLVRLPLLVARRGRWPLPQQDVDGFDVAGLGDGDVRTAATAARARAIGAARDALAEAGPHFRALPAGAIVAALPVAVVGPYLRALSTQVDWLAAPAEITPLERVWRLGAARIAHRLAIPSRGRSLPLLQ
ncbi:MAG: squalene/phytoene synthase family protein [Hyphomicrobiaceae bacterium]|nr:squalene/phytoene synthase family protein [Hyphomicrobiaceae bacterium]